MEATLASQIAKLAAPERAALVQGAAVRAGADAAAGLAVVAIGTQQRVVAGRPVCGMVRTSGCSTSGRRCSSHSLSGV